MTTAARPVRLRPALAPTVAAISVAATVVGLVFACSRPTVENLVQGHLIGDALAAIAAALVGALLLMRLPGQPVGVLFAAVGLADGVALLASGAQSARPDDVLALWVAEWTWVPGLGLLLLLPLLVPDGVRARWERILLGAGLIAIGLATAGAATSAWLASGPSTSVPNPLAVPGGDAVQNAGLIGVCAVATAGVVALVLRVIRADSMSRRRLLPFVAAGVLAIAAVSIAPLLGIAGVVLQDAVLLLVPAGCAISVLRLRLYDVEIAIGRSLVWILLTAVLLGGYVAVVVIAGRVLRLPGLPSSIVATAIVAVAFAPVRAAVERAIARWLYGGRGDPASALAATTRLLTDREDATEALDRAILEIASALRSPGAWIRRGDVVLAGPAAGPAAAVVPLRIGDRELGLLEILARSPGERFSPSDERLLAQLAPALAAGVAAMVAQEDLLHARSMLAVTREADRRRVREQLHDDIGPGLAAVALQVQTAVLRLRRSDLAGAEDALSTVSRTMSRATQDLRTAVDALGPRALDELGLSDAVTALARAADGDRMAVHVDVGVLPPLSPAVEAAAYRIAAEALTNVLRHAKAANAWIELRAEEGALEVRVRDDGTATRLDRPGGIGVASMRARAEELGGTFTITSDDGTLVVARLPSGTP